MYSACSLAKSELEVKVMVGLPVQEWTPAFEAEATCHVTPSACSLFHEQKGTNASETGQADRRYRAVYELFSYFYSN